jgi:exopolyphosphatase/guanosine-5'-triphosphate,3'-diphosphate pyrophosphatase
MQSFESPYFAAVDLGSNSFHMIICRVNQDTVETVDRVKDMVQIARGMQSGTIAEDARERALQCLKRFAERLRGIPAAQVRAVGTKSLRSAKNVDDFLRDAEQALGHPISIISGFEEARLVYKGLAHCVANDNNRRLVIDIGGASTEFIIGRDAEPEIMESLSFGCVVYTEKHDLKQQVNARGMRSAYLAACAELEAIRPTYLKRGWDMVYGTSGTMRAIADLVAPDDGGAIIRATSLRELSAEVIENSEKALQSMPKLRRDVLPAGIAVLRAIFDQLKLDKIHVADSSLKEGLIYDTIGRFNNVDARYAAVAKLQGQYNIDLAQADRVARTAIAFWRQINAPDLPGVSRTKILTWAAQLHEVGLGISHSSHHNHGYYILRHSDLAGFGRYEQHLLACLVRAHRKKIHEDRFDGMEKKVRLALLPMLVCLRMAVVLHRSREDLPVMPNLKQTGNTYSLIFPKGWLEENPLTMAGLEKEVEYFLCAAIELKILEA